jgi:signal transduction histidine kinase
METFFATPERSSPEDLRKALDAVCHNPIIEGVLNSVSGMVAILDEHRQILTVNDSMLRALGLPDTLALFGLRPGEAISCLHAHEVPAGCGTTKFCSSCGAAIAIVSSLANEQPEERLCAATVKRNGSTLEICFQVRAVPIRLDSRQLILLFMQDITSQQNWAAVEKIFFHDLSNIVCGLSGATEVLALRSNDAKLVEIMERGVQRLKTEIEIQKILCQSKNCCYQLSLRKIQVGEIFAEIQGLMENHPVALDKRLTLQGGANDQEILTDSAMLLRILTNMLTNAFEATAAGGEVKFWSESTPEGTSFCTWNDQVIPEPLRLRIFQKHFTTKIGTGRGLGTYSMKLLGEEILKGRVDFTSSAEAGTVFRLIVNGVSVLPQ